MSEVVSSRRPLTSRNTRWAAVSANWLARVGVRPNQISVASVFFGTLACGALVQSNTAQGKSAAGWFVGAAMCIQLRLLCNLFDGMVAVEGGFKTKAGEIYNELPDRFADAFILAGAGYALGGESLTVTAGWAAAVAAVVTAYVRALGVAAGASQYFLGPMAKPHRMALMTFACLGAATAAWNDWQVDFMGPALWLVVAGCVITIFRRCRRIVAELEAK